MFDPAHATTRILIAIYMIKTKFGPDSVRISNMEYICVSNLGSELSYVVYFLKENKIHEEFYVQRLNLLGFQVYTHPKRSESTINCSKEDILFHRSSCTVFTIPFFFVFCGPLKRNVQLFFWSANHVICIQRTERSVNHTSYRSKF